MNQRTRADHRNVDRAERFLDRPLREDRLRPDREPHLRKIGHVSHARIDDQTPATPRKRGSCEQIPEIAVLAGARRRQQQDVAGFQLLDRHMDHPVVAGRRRDRHCASRDPRAAIDRTHVAGEKSDSALSLVHGGDSAGSQPVDDALFSPFDIPYDDVHASRSVRSRLEMRR
jgi:hypothetical protein